MDTGASCDALRNGWILREKGVSLNKRTAMTIKYPRGCGGGRSQGSSQRSPTVGYQSGCCINCVTRMCLCFSTVACRIFHCSCVYGTPRKNIRKKYCPRSVTDRRQCITGRRMFMLKSPADQFMTRSAP
ncbi:hypothetical protein, unlikely [Trypanosoma congolense IL3000]|uniref:Uncharacterized protein n=1 Tax=Trypanosoma congolense (strain IL3000) TaxID=1068625 RepID=F9WDX4_TRYCI|nr:hypothetical protein, unlikely [Trypanosoma congolense IL3000]